MAMSVYEEFVRLQTVMVRAVSRSWQDARFRDLFIESPIRAMKEYFDYDYPFDVKLVVKPSDDKNWHVFDPQHTGGWRGTNNTIRLALPPPPRDAAQKGEALAAFNQDRPLFLVLKSSRNS